MDAIKVSGLTKEYNDTLAVNNLNLTVKKGELFSLLGVNGAGKTTTIKMLSCLTRPSSGDATLNGFSILTESQKVKEIISVSLQETAVAGNLTVKENLKFICGIYGFSKEETNLKVSELTKKINLESVINKRASKLSGGYARRLSIAMSLISEPEILFLDEPTLGLDVISRSELWDIIFELKGSVTIVLTTHYMEEAERLSDRVGIMKDGILLTTGTVDDLMKKTNRIRFEDAFVDIVKGV